MEINKESSLQDFAWKKVVNGYMYKFLRLIVNKDKKNDEKDQNKISPIQYERRKNIVLKLKEYIETHTDNKITLKDLTNVVYLSPYYLSHIFKEETGYSPIQYFINTKINMAERLLKDPNLTISQISENLGYNSIHSFSSLFTAVKGVPPTVYRNKIFLKAK